MTQQNKNNKDSAYHERSLFGRRQGRPLSEMRQAALDEILPKVEMAKDLLSGAQNTAPSSFFSREFSSYWMEIGFGHGEHIATLSRENPDVGYLGAEPFINGMSAFLHDIRNDEQDNVRVLMDDGMIAARSIASESLDGIYVLNPDPWHKKRHYKRRIINQDNLDVFSTILRPGGTLVMTTDVEDLANWMCVQASNHPDFVWQARKRSDWLVPPKDWVTTRYEVKGAKNAKRMVYLFFEKR